MSLSDLASLGTFVSSVAVVVSLVFVGFQMRQNTRAVRAATSQAHATNWTQIGAHVSGSAEFARIWRLGVEDLGALDEDERVRFIVEASILFRFFEASRLQWRHRQLDDEHWQNIEAFLRDYASRPGFEAFWAARRHMHSNEFRTWYEALPRSSPVGGLFDIPATKGVGPTP